MSILVTGANGQVGFELLRRRGELPVTGLDRGALDITEPASIARALAEHAPELVINAAAYTAVDRAESEIEAAFSANRDGPGVLARACANAGIPLFHLSTDYVFDGTRHDPYPETAPAAPLGVYGRSKWEGEEAIRHSLPAHLILRVAWVFGAHGNNFVRTMLRLAKERPELRVVADQRGGPTPAAAIADTLLALAERHLQGDKLPWGTWHYCGAPTTSWHGFAKTIIDEAAALGWIGKRPAVTAITTADYPTPAQRPSNSALAMDQTQARLSIAPPDWRTGLREVLEEWKRAA